MAILNITYQGLSIDYAREISERMTDHDIRRTAVEIVRSGEMPGLQVAHLDPHAFDGFVVDRVRTPGGMHRIYLRPKVPFGA